MFSVILDGNVEDIKYVRREQDTVIKLGDTTIGQIFKLTSGYSVVVSGETTVLRSVPGFKTQHACTAYCLRALGIWKH